MLYRLYFDGIHVDYEAENAQDAAKKALKTMDILYDGQANKKPAPPFEVVPIKCIGENRHDE